MPTYAVHLPPVIPGAQNRRLIVKSASGIKIIDQKFEPDCRFSEINLIPEGKLVLVDGGVVVAEVDIPKRPVAVTIPPRPQDVPPEPEPVVPEPVVPAKRKPYNLVAIGLKHLKR